MASNLVAGDTNRKRDVFVRDLVTGITSLVSVGPTGAQGNLESRSASISADGRYVAFESLAANFAGGDSNSVYDVFVRDLVMGTTTAVSVDSTTVLGNRESRSPWISADGRYVAFESVAANLVPGDTNDERDIFVRELDSGTTTRVSVTSGGVEADLKSRSPSISANGQNIVFASSAINLGDADTNGELDIFLRNRELGTTTRLSVTPGGGQGNQHSYNSSISADGRYVAFESYAGNLVAGDTNDVWDVFVRDMSTGTTTRVSVDPAGMQLASPSGSPSISADGRYVAFSSGASNLVANDTNDRSDVFVRDLVTGKITRVSVNSAGVQANLGAGSPLISADGRYVAFESASFNLDERDTNGTWDIFVHDLKLGTTTMVSVGSSGVQVETDDTRLSGLSFDARYVVFETAAGNLVAGDTNESRDVFVRDLFTGSTTRASVHPAGDQEFMSGSNASLSANGRYVAFNYGRHVYVRDLALRKTTLVSLNSGGLEGNDYSFNSSISADGRYVAFESDATNLVTGDTNGRSDVFVRDLHGGTTVRVSVDSSGVQGGASSYNPSVSSDGRFVAFESRSLNLTPVIKAVGYSDIYRHETRLLGKPIRARLLFENWLGSLLPTTTSYVLRTKGGVIVSSGIVSIATDGAIEIPEVPVGEYELLLKAWVFLQKKVVFTQGATQVDLGGVPLLNGDVDNDNAVTILDQIDLSLAFDSVAGDSHWNPRADLDGDGSVTVFDYIILSQNFDIQGDE